MIQLLVSALITKSHTLYLCSANNPEMTLLIGVLGFLLMKGKMKSALVLIFGFSLCLANYFVFLEYHSFAIPVIYATGFAGISIILLLLLVYQFIHTS